MRKPTMRWEPTESHVSPPTRTTLPSSGRLTQLSAGGFPLAREIAVAYNASCGAQLATISSVPPSFLPASLWSITTKPSAVWMRRSILPTTRWPLSRIEETGYSAQTSLPGHVVEIQEKSALIEARSAAGSNASGDVCRESKWTMARPSLRTSGFEQAHATTAWQIEPRSFGPPFVTFL